MAKQSTVKLNWYGDQFLDVVKGDNERGLWAMGQIVLREAKGRAPKRQGRLRESGYTATTERTSYVEHALDRVKLPPVRDNMVVVAFAAFYSNMLEDTGASTHDIPYKPSVRKRGGKARVRTLKSKVLLIPGIGYRRRVVHPGHKRAPFLGPTIEGLRERITEEYAREMGRALEAQLPNA